MLARLLTPEEFGVVGMLLVFTGFAQVLTDGGLNSALIYKQEITERHRSTVFWIQSQLAQHFLLSFFWAAPMIAAFYSFPLLTPLSRLVACVFLIQAIGLTHYALLTKEFRFRALAAISFGSTILSGTVAVVVAWYGYGIWALVWQLLVAAAVATCLLWIISSWRPRLIFDGRAAMELGRYGIYLIGHGSINYWLRNGDNLLIGKFLGARDLGIYSRAYSLMLLPINNISGVVGQVMFPALAQLENEQSHFISLYLKATRLIALVSFPMMVGVAAYHSH